MKSISTLIFRGPLIPGASAVAPLALAQGRPCMSISQTSHVNIVSLLGFCLEGSKRALIYEYMPNGSLDKHIYSELAIGWEMLLKIAIGIARGLESCIRDATLTSYISISNLKTSF